MDINSERLWSRVEKLAEFTDEELPYTRRAFGDHYLQGREWLATKFRSAGLTTHIDPGGNLIGRLKGADGGKPRLGSGSHTDTVPAGGRFDGIAGVLAALEVAQTLSENGATLSRDFDVIDFLAEEPSDYGLSRVGSRALTSDLSDKMLIYKSADGSTLADGLRRVGGDPHSVAEASLAPGDYAAFVELHIEQGPVLEAENVPIGIVTDIVGIVRVDLSFVGRADHSGTTPMHLRADALVAASLAIGRTHSLASRWSRGSDYVVATVGKLDVTPNGSNVVPGRVDLTLEVRSSSDTTASALIDAICNFADESSQENSVQVTRTVVSKSGSATCHPLVQTAIEQACRRNGTNHRFMASGAGHDAACMSKVCPAGMIFIPCLDGRSHCPEEFATAEDLATGAQTLYDTILNLDESVR